MKKIFGISFLLVAFLFMESCGPLLKIFPKSWRGESSNDTGSPGSAPNTDPSASTDEDEQITTEFRLLRRISLDIRGELPSRDMMLALATGDNSLSTLVNSLMAGSKKYQMIGAHTRSAWKVKTNRDGALDYFYTLSPLDTSLPSGVTSADLKETMAQETFAYITWLLGNGFKVSDLTTFGSLFVSDTLKDMYPITEPSSGIPGTGFSLASFNDDRPSLGLLANPAFFSLLSHSTKKAGTTTAYEALDLVNCTESLAPTEHLLYSISEMTELDATNLTENVSCRQCHLPLQEFTENTLGLLDKTRFSSWLAYSAPTTQDADCSIYGQRCNSAEDWAISLGHNNSLALCFIKRLTGQMLQTPSNQLPSGSWFGELFTGYYQNFESLSYFLRQLVQTTYYQKPSFDYLESDTDLTTGTRFLGKMAWQNIAIQLTGDAEGMSISDDLEPGYETQGTEEYKIPGTPYALAVEKNAVALAKKIVSLEVRNGAFRGARKVLNILPDSPCSSIDEETIKSQIAEAWLLLTGYQLDDNENTLALGGAFFDIFSSSLEEPDDTDLCYESWETLLISIFLSPEFIIF